MPKALHDKLMKEAMAKGLKGKHRDAYVYGTMAKIEKQMQPGPKMKAIFDKKLRGT